MNLKKLIKSTDMKESENLCQDRSEHRDKIVHDRKGSYLVEASMTLPVLILCICAMALLIHVIAICENIGFSTAEEMHKICLDAYNDIKPASVQALHLRQKILKENPRITKFTVKKFRYLYEENGISESDPAADRSRFYRRKSCRHQGKDQLSRDFNCQRIYREHKKTERV